MWLFYVRSPRSDAGCRGGDRQGAFNRTLRSVMSMLSLGVNMGFYASCLDLFCRHTSLQSTCSIALMDPATALIGLAVKVEGCLSHREDANRLFGTAPRVQLRSGA